MLLSSMYVKPKQFSLSLDKYAIPERDDEDSYKEEKKVKMKKKKQKKMN